MFASKLQLEAKRRAKARRMMRGKGARERKEYEGREGEQEGG